MPDCDIGGQPIAEGCAPLADERGPRAAAVLVGAAAERLITGLEALIFIIAGQTEAMLDAAGRKIERSERVYAAPLAFSLIKPKRAPPVPIRGLEQGTSKCQAEAASGRRDIGGDAERADLVMGLVECIRPPERPRIGSVEFADRVDIAPRETEADRVRGLDPGRAAYCGILVAVPLPAFADAVDARATLVSAVKP